MSILGYETVVGLEVHAQLLTRSKIFCGCPTAFGSAPNTQICPVCAALPGVLPVLNRSAVDMVVLTGLAIHGHINGYSEFSRKNYFYPDLPAGYQISQYELPLVGLGRLTIQLASGAPKVVGITRIHLEVDAGKSMHEGIHGATWVDLNRTGTPLMEIVSEPDLRSAEEAREYLKILRATLRYLGVCDGNMEQGSLRCDANVSIRPHGSSGFGTRCEIKNLNSIRNVMRAIEYEAERHANLLEAGEPIVQETRLWDADHGHTRSMRGKEDAHDYRYFPEPDLPPLVVSEARIAALRAGLPELPEAKRDRFEAEHGLSPYDAGVLTATRELADYYEAVVAATGPAEAKQAANWVTVELLGRLNREGLEITQTPVSADQLGKLLRLLKKGEITGKIAKEVFATLFSEGGDAEEIVSRKGLRQVSDSGVIEEVVARVLAANPEQVESYRAGKTKVMGFFVGEIMKATRGQANPGLVNQLLKARLDGL